MFALFPISQYIKDTQPDNPIEFLMQSHSTTLLNLWEITYCNLLVVETVLLIILHCE